MLDDGDTILRLVGVALVLGIVLAVGVVALNFDPPESDGAPDANWTIERINDSHVQITYESGEPIRTDNLRVTVDSLERSTTFTDPVTPGETSTIDASDGSMVQIVWNGGRGDRDIMARERA